MRLFRNHDGATTSLTRGAVADELNVEIGGVVFTHRLYQFALAYCGWRHVSVIDSGESFMALSTGLQAVLWALGGVPEEHRTDSLSAAFNNLAEQEELTQRYADLDLASIRRTPSYAAMRPHSASIGAMYPMDECRR